MKPVKRKKKRSSQPQPPKKVADRRSAEEEEKTTKAIRDLEEAVASASLDDARGDLDRAAEILGPALSEGSDDPSTSSTSGEASSSVSGSGSSEGFVETSCVENLVKKRDCRRSKQKRLVAVTGTVSTVLGREYLMASPRKTKMKGFSNGVAGKEEAEQFLCSMLGDESELNLAIVRDVLC